MCLCLLHADHAHGGTDGVRRGPSSRKSIWGMAGAFTTSGQAPFQPPIVSPTAGTTGGLSPNAAQLRNIGLASQLCEAQRSLASMLGRLPPSAAQVGLGYWSFPFAAVF